MSAHTPGPWQACRSHEGFDGPYWDIDPDEQAEYDARPFVRIQAANGSVACAHDLFEFAPADARLIAAAPDMLAALQAIYKMGTDHEERDPYDWALHCEILYQAIAKATGESA